MPAVPIKEYLMMAAPLRNLKMICNIRNNRRKRRGIKAGYSRMLSKIWPRRSSAKARCIPHPGQGMPKNFMYGQGRL
jgi:hypothetical protein